jgi:hypothetical protein
MHTRSVGQHRVDLEARVAIHQVREHRRDDLAEFERRRHAEQPSYLAAAGPRGGGRFGERSKRVANTVEVSNPPGASTAPSADRQSRGCSDTEISGVLSILRLRDRHLGSRQTDRGFPMSLVRA